MSDALVQAVWVFLSIAGGTAVVYRVNAYFAGVGRRLDQQIADALGDDR